MKKKKNIRILISVGVAALLVMSVLTAAMTGVSGEGEVQTVEEVNDEILQNSNTKLDERLGNVQRNPTDGVDRLDVMDPEITQLLSGADYSGDGSMNSEGLLSDVGLLTDPHTIDQHNVEAVHDLGITGENVTVSLMDTGFDMGHPDLIGTQAVFEYDENEMPAQYEAYDGHPIAYDAASMAEYAVSGDAAESNWYVDTTYENTTYEEGDDIVANFTEKEENVTYIMPDGIDAGETVRFGLHPDEKLHTWYDERPALLLTQDEEENWTNVYVDLENDREFVDETRAWIEGENPESEAINKDVTGDDIADISGGMVYFIGDGENHIPYADHFRETMNKMINLGMGYPPGTLGAMEDYEDAWDFLYQSEEFDIPEEPNITPGDGDMVALMGDFNPFGSYGAHGTWTASAVAGQGVTGVPEEMLEEGEDSPYPPTPEGNEGLVKGLAPDAKIIPMGDFFTSPGNDLGQFAVTYSSIFFTTEGYTGDVDITADSADIASSSFGRSIDENHGGFNFYERLFDYVGTQHTQNTLFINSQGNEGSGFGTVSAPSGAQGVMSVGASGNQMYRIDEWEMHDGGPNPWYGEVTGMTSTGPHSKGSHGPDIMTNGQFGYGSDPVNQQLDNIGDFQGNNSWTLWSGTSLSAPNAAGITALVYQAYMEAHEEAPDSETLKNIVMQGANDMNNTPNKQGPGDANALASVEIAQGEGLYSEEFQWRPGTNPEIEEHVEHHVNIMEAGESVTDELTLHNWNEADAVEYNMGTYRQEKVDNTSIELESGPPGRVPLLMINETGVYELMYNETNDNWDLSDDPIATLDDPNADLLRFGTHTPYENQGMYDYSLTEFYNWEDVNDNGSFDGWEERNRIGYTATNMMALNTFFGDEVPTSDYFSIHDALERAEDGIIVQMNNDLYELGATSFDFTLNIEQYNQVEWDWISIDQPDGTIDPEDKLEYELTADVPENAPKGIYSGKLMIEDETNNRMLSVPITITVGEYTNLEEPMYFGSGDGDVEEDFGVYRNDRLYGSWEGDLTGDWRYYTFHLEEDITDRDIRLEIEFDDEMSDMSAFLLGGAEHDEIGLGMPEDPFSIEDPELDWDMQDRYGVNTLETLYDADINRGDYVSFYREEPLEAGTYMIVVQSHQISGYEPYQEFSGELRAEEMRASDPEPEDGAVGVPYEQPELSVYVEHLVEETQQMNVTFYGNKIGEQYEEIGTEEYVENGTRSSITWDEELEEKTDYEWYVEIEDEEGEIYQSEFWEFETKVYYNLTVGVEGEGSVTAEWNEEEAEIYDEWTEEIEGYTEVDLNAAPEDGWIFDGWTGDVPEPEWEWLYQAEHRSMADTGIGSDVPWYGAMILDLSDDIGDTITDVAYFDAEAGPDYAQAHIAEDDNGAPGEWLSSSGEYTPSAAGWVELGLAEPVTIEEPGEYWIVIEIDDIDGVFPFGAIEPDVEDGQYANFGDPHDPEDWEELTDYDLDYAWALEARIAPEIEEKITTMMDDDKEITAHFLEEPYFEVNIDVDEKVLIGEEAVVDYTVTNTGGVLDTQDIEFYVDDVLIETEEDVTVDGGSEYHGEFIWTPEELEEYDLKVASEDDQDEVTVTVVEDPAFFDVEIVDYDEEVFKGENVTVGYKVENTGDLEDTQTIMFYRAEVLDDWKDVTLDGGEVHEGEFVWTEADSLGEHTVQVLSDDDADEVTVSILEELDPGYFEVEITDYDDEVEEGDTVTVEFTVENIGDKEDTQEIIFSVEGDERDTIEMTLGGGETESREFTWEAEEEDDYNLTVESDNDYDTVIVTVEEEEDIPGFTLALFGLGAALAIAVYYKKNSKEDDFL